MGAPVTLVDDAQLPGKALGTSGNPLFTSDRSGTYRRAAAIGTGNPDGLLVTGVTTAGSVTVTLAGGGSIPVNVGLGSNFLPLAASAVNVGSTGGTAYNLFNT